MATHYRVTGTLYCTSIVPGEGQLAASAGPVLFTIAPRSSRAGG